MRAFNTAHPSSPPETSDAPSRCPLCGEDNDCAMVKGRESCWCHEVKIPDQVIRRIPPDARGVACVCRACALGEHSQNTE